MYYIEDQDPILVKNEVILDREVLRRLNQEILATFGGYEHRAYDGVAGPYTLRSIMDDDVRYIRNYTQTSGTRETAEGMAAPEEALSHYEYDEYTVPKLCRLIDRLLKGDATAIDEIKKGPDLAPDHQKNEQKQWQLQLQLQMLLNSAPDKLDTKRFEELTDQIRSCYAREYGVGWQRDLQACYEQVLNCIHFKPVLTLYKDKLKEYHRLSRDIGEFYEGTDPSWNYL